MLEIRILKRCSTHHHLVHDDSHSPPVHGSSVVIVLQHLPKDFKLTGSVPDPDPSDPHVFGPPGSKSVSTRYYGSGSRSFYHQAKNGRKTLIPNVLQLLYDFLSLKMM